MGLSALGRTVSLTTVAGITHVDRKGETVLMGQGDVGGEDLPLEGLALVVSRAEVVDASLADGPDVVAGAGKVIDALEGIADLLASQTGGVIGMDRHRRNDVLVGSRQFLGELGPLHVAPDLSNVGYPDLTSGGQTDGGIEVDDVGHRVEVGVGVHQRGGQWLGQGRQASLGQYLMDGFVHDSSWSVEAFWTAS